MSKKQILTLPQAYKLPFFYQNSVKAIQVPHFDTLSARRILFLEPKTAFEKIKNEVSSLFKTPDVFLISKYNNRDDSISLEELSFSDFERKLLSFIDILDEAATNIHKDFDYLSEKLNLDGLFKIKTKIKFLECDNNIDKNYNCFVNLAKEYFDKLYERKFFNALNDNFENSKSTIEFFEPNFNIGDTVGYISNGSKLPIGYYLLKIKKINFILYPIETNSINFIELEMEIIETNNAINSYRNFNLSIRSNDDGEYNTYEANLSKMFDSKFLTDYSKIEDEYKKLMESSGLSPIINNYRDEVQ